MKSWKGQTLPCAVNASQGAASECKSGQRDEMSCVGKYKHVADTQEVA